MDPLLVTLLVIEERQQGSERVGDGGGAEVVLKYLEHLETPILVGGASVLEEKTWQGHPSEPSGAAPPRTDWRGHS